MAMNTKRQATKIANLLFVNGAGERATRLVLVKETDNVRVEVSGAEYLGGFSIEAVIDIIADALNKSER